MPRKSAHFMLGDKNGETLGSGRRTVYVVAAYMFLLHVLILLGAGYAPTPSDEILAGLLAPLAIFGRTSGAAKKSSLYLPLAVYGAVGIACAVYSPFKGVPQPVSGLYDLALDMKLPLMYLGFCYLLKRDGCSDELLKKISYVFVVIAIVNSPFVVYDFLFGGGFGMRGQPLTARLGMFQPHGLLYHHTDSCWRTFIGALCSFYLYKKCRTRALGLITLYLISIVLIHLSTKESLMLLILMAFFGDYQFKRLGPALSRILVGVVFFAIILAFTPLGDLVERQFDEYIGIGSDDAVRTVMTIQSFRIMYDFFPFGVGAGMYASPPSYQFGYSEVYHEYGISSLWGAGYSSDPSEPIFLLDVFFPKLLAQVGFIGLLAYLIFLRRVASGAVSWYAKVGGAGSWLVFSVIGSVLVFSIASTPLTNEFMAVVFALFSAFGTVRFYGERRVGRLGKPMASA